MSSSPIHRFNRGPSLSSGSQSSLALSIQQSLARGGNLNGLRTAFVGVVIWHWQRNSEGVRPWERFARGKGMRQCLGSPVQTIHHHHIRSVTVKRTRQVLGCHQYHHFNINYANIGSIISIIPIPITLIINIIILPISSSNTCLATGSGCCRCCLPGCQSSEPAAGGSVPPHPGMPAVASPIRSSMYLAMVMSGSVPNGKSV